MSRAVEKAASFRIRGCSCCGVHIDLFDADGAPFASASFSPEIARTSARELAEVAELVASAPSEPERPTAH